MGKIITSGEEKRPRIRCFNCKHENIIDIRGWNRDVTMLGKIKCKLCNKKMYVSLLILADISVEALGTNVQAIVNMLGEQQVLRQGDEDKTPMLKN